MWALMGRRKESQRVVPYNELMARADNLNPDALMALRSLQKIRDAGGKPEVRYSDFAGYDVVDLLADPPPPSLRR